MVFESLENGDFATFRQTINQNRRLVSARDPNHQGWTPLHVIAILGNAELAEFILSAGADVNITNDFGYTPLLFAAANGRYQVAKLLLSKGANVNAMGGSDGYTPLHAASKNGRTEIVQLLLANGAEINARKSDGWTALHLAVLDLHKDVVKLLLSKGANAEIKNDKGMTPLQLAAQYHLNEIKELLGGGTLQDEGMNQSKQNSGKRPWWRFW